MEPLLTIENAAGMLGISPWTVRRYIGIGKIKPVRIGRRVLVEPSELRRIIDEGRVKEECPVGTPVTQPGASNF